MKMCIVNGFPRSGKDTFVEYCIEMLDWRGKCVSTVDFVKEIATKCGWDGVKTPKNRKFLSDLKDLLTDWDNVPLKKIRDAYRSWNAELHSYNCDTDECILFVMCREPKEIQKLVDAFDAFTVFVQRDAVEGEQSNHADAEVRNFKYDYFVDNNGSLDELKERAEEFLNLMNPKRA